METQNPPTEVTKLTAKALFNKDEVKAKFQEMLGKRATSFITSVLQIVASNKYLQNAEPNSIYQAAAIAATLDLPLNNTLGFACIVPYNESYNDNGTWKKRQVAQFQMMYKGYKQLALRSGQFITMHATDVRAGELLKRNRLTGEIAFKWEEDEDKRLALPIIGYVSYFELLNGFSQTFYMTVKELHDHGKKYSQTFQNNKGKWVDDFPAMCLKTVTKLNLSKNAPLSVDMQKAIIADQAVIKDADTMEVDYVDNENTAQLDEPPATHEQLTALMADVLEDLTKKEFDDCKRILDNKEENSYRKIQELLKSKVKDNGVQ